MTFFKPHVWSENLKALSLASVKDRRFPSSILLVFTGDSNKHNKTRKINKRVIKKCSCHFILSSWVLLEFILFHIEPVIFSQLLRLSLFSPKKEKKICQWNSDIAIAIVLHTAWINLYLYRRIWWYFQGLGRFFSQFSCLICGRKLFFTNYRMLNLPHNCTHLTH